MLIRGIRGQPNRHEFHEISGNDLLTVAPKKNRLALLIAPRFAGRLDSVAASLLRGIFVGQHAPVPGSLKCKSLLRAQFSKEPPESRLFCCCWPFFQVWLSSLRRLSRRRCTRTSASPSVSALRTPGRSFSRLRGPSVWPCRRTNKAYGASQQRPWNRIFTVTRL